MKKFLQKLLGRPTQRHLSKEEEAKVRTELEDLFRRIERDYPLDPPHGRYWN